MTLLQRDREMRAEGRAEERLETIQNMLREGYSKEAIRKLKYSKEEIQTAENAMLVKE